MLRKEDGQATKIRREMEHMTREFFKNLYAADMNVSPDDLLHVFEPCISDEANTALCKDFSYDDALFQIGPLKAPGPDGFPERFFQKNWATLKPDIIRGVKEFSLFESGVMSPDINETTIVLIPKINEPEFLKNFSPISLCNVIYKVIAKCLVNRLRPLLHEIIEPSQSAFIPVRMITDNALIFFNVFMPSGMATRDANNLVRISWI
jgi:hypothetical protein